MDSEDHLNRVLQRISDILLEEEESHSDLAELFVMLVENDSVKRDPATLPAVFSAMQSFDKTKQRIDYFIKLAKCLSASKEPQDLTAGLTEVGMPPVEDDALWLDSIHSVQISNANR